MQIENTEFWFILALNILQFCFCWLPPFQQKQVRLYVSTSFPKISWDHEKFVLFYFFITVLSKYNCRIQNSLLDFYSAPTLVGCSKTVPVPKMYEILTLFLIGYTNMEMWRKLAVTFLPNLLIYEKSFSNHHLVWLLSINVVAVRNFGLPFLSFLL